jgi:LacI family transcriptional regulator
MVTIPYSHSKSNECEIMPTIHDVAKLAGVAPITVSRVINNSGYASAETRQRVEEAAAELGYVPNRMARGLRTKHSNSIALVLTDITNPFFTTVARGVEVAANAAGYTVTYCNTDEDAEKEKRYLDLLIQQQVDGILLVPAHGTADSVAYVQKHHTSVVVLDRRLAEVKTDVVRCDSEGGAYQLVRLLLDLGHQRIALLGGPEGASTAEDRRAGYRRAMAASGYEVAGLELCGSFTQASGYEMAQEVIAQTPRPTALFAANNFIAIGALKALLDNQISVPQDMALVGFDDLPPALVTFPFLTVAAQPAYEMAQIGAELLLARIAGEEPEAYQEIVLPTELIVRQSSGKALYKEDK